MCLIFFYSFYSNIKAKKNQTHFVFFSKWIRICEVFKLTDNSDKHSNWNTQCHLPDSDTFLVVSHHLLNLVERDVLAVHQTDHLPVRQDTWTLKTDLTPCSLKHMLTTLTTTMSLSLMLTTLGPFCTSSQSSDCQDCYPKASRFSDYTSRWVQRPENCSFLLNIFHFISVS